MFFDFGNLADLGTFGTALMLFLIVWSIVWKGIALWTAAKEGSKTWFVVLIFLNTFGILDIIYLFCFSNWASIQISRLRKRKVRRQERSRSPF